MPKFREFDVSSTALDQAKRNCGLRTRTESRIKEMARLSIPFDKKRNLKRYESFIFVIEDGVIKEVHRHDFNKPMEENTVYQSVGLGNKKKDQGLISSEAKAPQSATSGHEAQSSKSKVASVTRSVSGGQKRGTLKLTKKQMDEITRKHFGKGFSED